MLFRKQKNNLQLELNSVCMSSSSSHKAFHKQFSQTLYALENIIEIFIASGTTKEKGIFECSAKAVVRIAWPTKIMIISIYFMSVD